MFQYVTIGLLAVIALFVIVNVVKALIRGLKKTIGTLIAIVLSAVIAAIITFIICSPTSALFAKGMAFVESLLPELAEIFAIEGLEEAVSHYALMIAAPFFFVSVYAVVSLIVSIIVSIVIKIICGKKGVDNKRRLAGAGVGLICGLLVSILILMPVVGTITLVTSLEDTSLMESAGDSADTAELEAILTDASDSKLIQILNKVGCGPLYDMFASSKFDGEKIYLKNDIGAIVAMVDNATVLGVDISQYSQEQIDALDGIVTSLDTSPLLKNVAAGLFSTAAEKWLAGESFIGIEGFSVGELLDPLVDKMLLIMTTSDKDNISADLETMKDIFAILIENDMLNMEGDQDTLDKLSESGVIGELIVVVNKNERMAPLADEITLLSIRTLASNLGLPADSQENYDNLMNSIAGILNDSKNDTDRAEAIKPQLKETFEKYGIKVSGEASDNITESIIADLGGLEGVTADDVQEFFTVYAVARAQAVNDVNVFRYKAFTNINDEKAYEFTVNDDGTVSVDGRVLKNYTAENYLTSGAFIMGDTNVDFGGAATLMSSLTMESSIVTMDTILSFIGSYSDCEDVEAEAAKISEIVSEAMGIFTNVDFENANPTELMASMGGLLDKMKDTTVFGSRTVESLMKAILQSDAFGSALGLSKSELTDFADKISEVVNAENSTDYTAATKAVSGTINAIVSTTDTEKTREEKIEATKDLIENITTESAEMVSSLVSSNLVMGMGGVVEEHAEAVSSAMSSMLNNMAKYKENNETADNHDKEAEAVNTILDMAMNITSEATQAPLFSNDENEGVLGTTADEFIDMVVKSEVVSQTVVETVKGNGYTDNPLGLPELSESEKESVTATLESYFVNNGGDAELAATLESIATIINIDLSLMGNQE